MEILKFVKDYWTILTFLLGMLGALIVFIKSIVEATRCSLRNDILDIYDRCKETRTITHYQLQAIMYSYKIYKKLKGNSFIEEIIEKVKQFELLD